MKNKNKGAVGIVAIIAIVVVLVIFLGGQWNSLVKLDEDVNGACAQVQNQVKRRADLIPNIPKISLAITVLAKVKIPLAATPRQIVINPKRSRSFSTAAPEGT